MNNVVSLPTAADMDRNSGPPPVFIRPQSINDMDDAQMDAMLDVIRVKRLQAHHVFNETRKLRNEADKHKLSLKYDKAMNALATGLDKFDKQVEKLEKAVNEVRILRLQMGQDPL